MTPNAVNVTNHTIKFYGKGSKERIIQIENLSVRKAVEDYRNLFESDISASGYFFVNKLHSRLTEQSVREMINKYAMLSDSGMQITPHMFRYHNNMKTHLLNFEVYKQIYLPAQITFCNVKYCKRFIY